MTAKTTFAQFPFSEGIMKALVESGYENPTPIQEQAIPTLLEGRDLLGCAQTGTGKTAAFALPLLHRLKLYPKKLNPKGARVLVLTPTRELALQVHDSFRAYGKYINLRSACIFGGVGQMPQVKSMQLGVEVLVATPGRLLDLINQRFVQLADVEVFVLDEADRMLDMGFIHDIKKIIQLLPPKRHNLFFSATMPTEIAKLADTILKDPVKVEVARVSSTVEIIQQKVMFVEKENKRELLKYLLDDRAFKKVIIFTRTKHGANKVSDFLKLNRIKSDAIHGNKSQSARQRALDDFKKGQLRVLVATDIAARGIDVDDITHVINFDLTHEPESYVHRIGRTGRAGAQGVSISFCDAEEKAFLKQIEKLINKSIPVDYEQPYHSMQVENAVPMKAGKAKSLIDSRNKFPPRRNVRSNSRDNRERKPQGDKPFKRGK